jgi:hypothetical protein
MMARRAVRRRIRVIATRNLIQFGIAQNGEIVGHANNLLLSVSSGTLVLFDEFVKGRTAP